MPPQRMPQLVAAIVFAFSFAAIAADGASAYWPAQSRAVTSAHAMQITPRPEALTSRPSLKHEVFGFAYASSLTDPTVGYPSWNFSLLSTVAFYSLHVNWDGRLIADSDWAVWNSSDLTAFVNTAHSHGTKVVVGIDLQDFSPGTPTMCDGLINRTTTILQTVQQVKAKAVDGVNVDYEGLNGTCQNGQTAQSMMTAFAAQLRAALPSGSYLSIDTYASSAVDSVGFFDIAGLNAYVDAFMVMAYDLEYSNYYHWPLSCSSFCLGPTSALKGYYYNDSTTASQYAGVVGASKVILGVPYYGRKACVTGVSPNAYPIGPVSADSYLSALDERGASVVRPGSYTTHRDANDPTGQERWDTWYNTSLGCTRELYWDDAVSLGHKYDLVNQAGLRGVGIWTLSYGGGSPELWTALSSHFAVCRAATIAAGPASAAPVGAAVTVTGAGVGCPGSSPLYEFWIQAPGSTTWRLAQAYSTKATLDWSTRGAAPGAYSVTVWVRDSGSPGYYSSSLGRWDAYAPLRYRLTPTPCTAASIAPATPSPHAIGGAVTVNASAGGCPNPLYEFWVLAPGRSWQVAQLYSRTTTFSWTTAGRAPGLYHLTVWVRDVTSTGTSANSVGRWDAYAGSPYIIFNPCVAQAASAAPASPSRVGIVVTVKARASACIDPLYEFWLLAPGATTWAPARAYGTAPAFAWSTAGLATGAYRVTVWERDGNSSGTAGNAIGRWDTQASFTYVVAPDSCASVKVSASPATSSATGAKVTFSASAQGCPNPLYEFWIRAPGAAGWQAARSYSTAATFTWTTTGLARGSYEVAVWARDSTSAGVSSNSLGGWDAFAASYLTLK